MCSKRLFSRSAPHLLVQNTITRLLVPDTLCSIEWQVTESAFLGIANRDDFWSWAQGPMVDTLYPQDPTTYKVWFAFTFTHVCTVGSIGC